MSSSLKSKTITGVGWSAVDAVAGQGVSFFVGLVLARLLSPSEFGLIGITTIFITILSGFVDCGFSNALIRKRDVSDNDYNTMFITNLVISIVMYGILYFCAPLIARFFERVELIELVRVVGLVLVIHSLSIVQYTVLTKRIDFKTKTKASLISSSISGVIGIGMAFYGFGVWSLVAQRLSRELLFTICLWVFNKWWPKLRFCKESFSYMWGFGWRLMLSGLLNNTWNQLYHVVVGKFYSPATLGQYSRAKEYANLFSHNFTNIIQRVSYPVLAEVQDDNSRMVGAYRKIIKLSMFITAIIMISMGAVADPLIYCLIGPKWHQAATFLPFICISLSLYPLHSINLNMLKVQGRSDIFLYLEIIKKIIAIGPILLGIFVNIYWMLIGSILTSFISLFLNTYYTGKKLNYTTWMQIKDIAPSYGIAFLIALSVYFLKYIPVSYFIILPIQILIGTGVFFFVCEKTQLEEYVEVKSIAKQYLSKIKRKK
jgi:O-antigen/teichoic acid export membrane protein